MPSRPLPLGSVRAFDAAARHLNFTKAAAELGLTQAAVSWQIRTLEQRLGVLLFDRRKSRLSLTPSGEMLRIGVADALARLEHAFDGVLSSRPSDVILRISSTPTFANNWLVPRLGRFRAKHRGVSIRLDASTALANLEAGDADISVRRGKGDWEGLVCRRLFPVVLAPMCAPRLIGNGTAPFQAADVLKLPLLQSFALWKPWLDCVGYVGAPAALNFAASFPRQHMVEQAAIAGQGVALLNPRFCADALEEGRLVMPISDVFVNHADGYWLVCTKERAQAEEVRAFGDWLLQEIVGSSAS